MMFHTVFSKTMFARIVRYLFIFCFCASSLACIAQAQEDSATVRPQAAAKIAIQVQEHSFNLNPGGSFTFTLPNVKSPIRIEISSPSTNGGVQEPSEVMWALVNKDSGNGQITWIGTSSDGSTSGSNSLQNTNIANITCGPGCTVSSLVVANAAAGTLSVTRSSVTTIITGSYIVRLYF